MRLRAAVVCVAAALGVGLLAAAPAGASVGSGFYGVNAYWLFSTPQTEWPAQLQSIVDGGLTTVRTDARWSAAEPNPPTAGQHTYDWSFFDTMVGNLAKYGLRWMPTLDYPPPWAQENPNNDLGSEVTEANVPDFVAFAAALVRRYGIGGTFWAAHPELPVTAVREWEIWNSPNVTYYWDPQDNAPERYTDLYVASRAAIKQVNAKAIVIGPALDLVNPPIASDEIEFVKRMFEHDPDIGSKVDVWGLHPYQETIYWTFRRLAMWRQALDLLAGRRVPIAIDELGYTTTKVTDQMRGDELTELTQQLPRSGCDIYDFLPYTWVSPENDPSVPGPADDPERWFGIWNRDGTPKPSGQQFVDAVLQMRGLSSTPAPTDQLNLCDSQFPVPPDPQKPVAPKSLTVPTDPVPPPPDAPQVTPPKLRGPGLHVTVTRDRRHRLLKISVKCATPCKLNGYLMTRKRGKSRYRTQSTTGTRKFKLGRQLLRLRLPAHAAKLRRQGELIVVATDRGGVSSRVSRKVLIH